jgi:hypothetical protein
MSKHLTKAIAWTIVTLIGIGLGFYYLPATDTHLAMICLVSIAGFLTAFGEYLHYKQSKKVTRWEQ